MQSCGCSAAGWTYGVGHRVISILYMESSIVIIVLYYEMTEELHGSQSHLAVATNPLQLVYETFSQLLKYVFTTYVMQYNSDSLLILHTFFG